MLADVMLQAFDAVVSNYEPELKRPKAATERGVPVTIVDDCSRFGRLVAEIFRQDTQGLNEGFAVGNVENITVKIGEHPLVGIEAVAIGELNAWLRVAEFGTERSGA